MAQLNDNVYTFFRTYCIYCAYVCAAFSYQVTFLLVVCLCPNSNLDLRPPKPKEVTWCDFVFEDSFYLSLLGAK